MLSHSRSRHLSFSRYYQPNGRWNRRSGGSHQAGYRHNTDMDCQIRRSKAARQSWRMRSQHRWCRLREHRSSSMWLTLCQRVESVLLWEEPALLMTPEYAVAHVQLDGLLQSCPRRRKRICRQEGLHTATIHGDLNMAVEETRVAPGPQLKQCLVVCKGYRWERSCQHRLLSVHGLVA